MVGHFGMPLIRLMEPSTMSMLVLLGTLGSSVLPTRRQLCVSALSNTSTCASLFVFTASTSSISTLSSSWMQSTCQRVVVLGPLGGQMDPIGLQVVRLISSKAFTIRIQTRRRSTPAMAVPRSAMPTIRPLASSSMPTAAPLAPATLDVALQM